MLPQPSSKEQKIKRTAAALPLPSPPTQMSTFIPGHTIEHLKEYRYQSEDRSLTTKYILKPFWVKFEKIFPLWMAPNMVTLLGLLFIVVSDILIFYYDPDYQTVSPQWLYYYHGFAIFMYQTFDACDGIHARNTGQSSPLGELFDHCCDSMNTTLMVIQNASVSALGDKPELIFLVQFSCLTNFYLSTWEEYYTHKLFLSEISGPVEGLLMLSGVCFATGYFGVDLIWKTELFKFNQISITSTYIFALCGSVVMVFSIYSASRNVIKSLKSQGKHNEINNALQGLLPFFIYYLTILFLFLLHPTIISNYTNSMVLTIGACISFNVGKIILGHLTKQEFPYVNFPLFLPVVQAILIELLTNLFHFSYNEALNLVIYGGLGASFMVYAMFIREIIFNITEYLDIWALTIKHPAVVKKD